MFNSLDPSMIAGGSNGRENRDKPLNIRSGGAELETMSIPSPPQSPKSYVRQVKLPQRGHSQLASLGTAGSQS